MQPWLHQVLKNQELTGLIATLQIQVQVIKICITETKYNLLKYRT